MALHAALGASKVLILLGASVAGSILVQNGSLSDFVSDTYKVLVKHLKHEKDSNKQSSVDPSLLAQLSRLRQELSHLASERSSITIVSGSSRSYGVFISIGVPVLVIGATGYGYIRWQGLSLSDLMYVTKYNMANAIATVSKQLEQVTSALTGTKKHLNIRIDRLSNNLDQNMELQGELKDEVGNLRGDVARYGIEIETVQRIVQSLGVKINSIENKQDIANMGVIYLCNFVEGVQVSQQSPASQGSVHRPRLERAASAFGSTGLKELQTLSNALEPPGRGLEEGPSGVVPASLSLQRNWTNTSSPSTQKQ